MEEALNQVVALLRAQGIEAALDTAKQTPWRFGHLVIGKIRVAIERNSKRQIILDGVKYTDYKHGGYKVRDIAKQIVASIPRWMGEAEERETAQWYEKQVQILRDAHRDDKRLRIWRNYDGTFTFQFNTADFTEFGVVLDRVHEMQDWSNNE